MNKKIALQASACLTAALWLVLAGCSGMGGGSGCGGAPNATGCSGSPPKCATGFRSECRTNNNTGSSTYVCVQQ